VNLRSVTCDLGSLSLLSNRADSLVTNFTNLCKHINEETTPYQLQMLLFIYGRATQSMSAARSSPTIGIL